MYTLGSTRIVKKNLMPAVACEFTQTPRILIAQALRGYLETHTDQNCGFVQKPGIWVTPFCARTPVHTHIFTKSTHMHFSWTLTGLKGLGFNSPREGQRQSWRKPLILIVLAGKRGKQEKVGRAEETQGRTDGG